MTGIEGVTHVRAVGSPPSGEEWQDREGDRSNHPRFTARASQDGHILAGRSSNAAAVSASTTGPKTMRRRMKSTPRKS